MPDQIKFAFGISAIASMTMGRMDGQPENKMPLALAVAMKT